MEISTQKQYVVPTTPLLGQIGQPDYRQLLQNSLITLSSVIEEPPTCIEICSNGDIVPIATLGNLSMFIGKAKQGKSFAVTLALAAACSDQSFQDTIRVKLPEDQNRVALFDTEQSDYHCQKSLRRIGNLLGVDSVDKLDVHALRKYAPAERLGIIKHYIYNTPGIGLVVIDGIRDLITSINDEEQATMVVSGLMKWTTERNIHILVVLHANKSDDNARGHIGTELTNKCETVMAVVKDSSDKDVVVIEPRFTRDKSFEPIAFRIDELGMPQFIEWQGKKRAAVKDKNTFTPTIAAPEIHANIIKDVFKISPEMSYNVLLSTAKAVLSSHNNGINVSKDRTIDWINYWLGAGYLDTKGTPGTKSSKYYPSHRIGIIRPQLN